MGRRPMRFCRTHRSVLLLTNLVMPVWIHLWGEARAARAEVQISAISLGMFLGISLVAAAVAANESTGVQIFDTIWS